MMLYKNEVLDLGFLKCEQIYKKLRFYSHLLKEKSLKEKSHFLYNESLKATVDLWNEWNVVVFGENTNIIFIMCMKKLTFATYLIKTSTIKNNKICPH